MTAPVLFIDTQFFQFIFGSGSSIPQERIDQGLRILDQIKSQYDVQITDGVLDETVQDLDFPKDKAVSDWLNRNSITPVETGYTPGSNQGEVSITAAFDSEQFDGVEKYILSSDKSFFGEGHLGADYVPHTMDTSDMMGELLDSGKIEAIDYLTVRDRLITATPAETWHTDEHVIEKSLSNKGITATSDGNGHVIIDTDGNPTTTGDRVTVDPADIVRDPTTSSSIGDFLGKVGTEAEAVTSAFDSAASRAISGATGLLAKLGIAAMAYDIETSFQKAVDLYNDANYGGAANTLAALEGRTALGLAGAGVGTLIGLDVAAALVALGVVAVGSPVIAASALIGGVIAGVAGALHGTDLGPTLAALQSDILKEFAQALSKAELAAGEWLDENLPRPVSDALTMVEGLYNDLHLHGSPLTMDISGAGISLSAMGSTGSVYWDIDSDGHREASGWIANGTGLLCVDANSNGVIDDNSELFGNQPAGGVANGFQALSAYDSNSDGVIDSSDTNFGNLLVWVDANSDGISQSSELQTLSALNITSIDLGFSTVNYEINDNQVRQESTFVMGGNTRTIADVWFHYDNVNTVSSEGYEIDPRVLLLPEQRGYGNLSNLSMAMSQNSDLLDMVSDVASKTARELFTESYDLRTKLQAIMYEWAGVTGNATDRTGFIEFTTDDTRRVDFLDALMDNQLSGGINQEWFGKTWDYAVSVIGGNLLLQSGLNELFDHPIYNAATDTWSGGTLGTDPTLLRFMPLYHYSDNLHDSGFNDIYVLTPGVTADGGFVIQEPNGQGTDTLLLGGVDAADVKIWTGSYGDLVIQYTDDDQVTISGSQDMYGKTTTGDRVEHILFDDGTLG